MKEPLSFVKNLKTGVVFPLTRVLTKMRKDLVACTRHGLVTTREHIDMPNLCNPYTGAIFPNNEENSRIVGLIPCRDEDHAEEIKAALMGMGGNVVEQTQGGLKEPPIKVINPDEIPSDEEILTAEEQAQALIDENKLDSSKTNPPTPDEEFITMLRSVDVETMGKEACKGFALEHFGEKLSLTNGEETLREKVQVMINGKLAEAA